MGSVANILRLNNQDYQVNINLYSTQGQAFPINTASIVSLIIEEDSRRWYKKGTLVLDNKENALERRPNEFVSKDLNYKFRNDGRDLLFINIKPVINSDNYTDNSPFPDELWEMSYIFSIYDVEDINTGPTSQFKNKKLYFWELDHQILLETASSWSTNLVLYQLYPELEKYSYQLGDEDRKVATGDAIKSLLETVLADKTTAPKFSDNWDPGSSYIFYTPPNSNFAADDLEYLLHRHVCSKYYGNIEGDVPLLFRDRYSKIWSLISLSRLFNDAVLNKKTAGPLQLEQFLIASANANSVLIPSLRHTPQDPQNQRNLFLGQLGAITNFQFVDMAPIDNTYILSNYPCYSNNIKRKQFNLDYQDNTSESIKDFFQKNYVDKLGFEAYPKPKALLTLNKNKTEAHNLKPSYSYGATKFDRYADFRNPVLKASLFLNQCLSFTVPGSTFRQVNTFIGVDRSTGSVDADFDEKLLGQWFVFKVTHEFTQTSYSNTIVGVKPHADKDIRIDDSVA